jgi:XTP/dITP diphosphohydrolase
MSIILASTNKGKIGEFQSLLSSVNISILDLNDIQFKDEIIEDGSTLEENAYIKAKAIHDFSKKMVLSDDSGLFVEALGGDPGIYSARYAGEGKSNEDNINLLLQNLESIENRKAYFGCVLCFMEEDGNHVFFEGRINGNIALKKSGGQGFGYDPIFIPEGYDKSFAELDLAVKNKLSHRAQASQLFFEFIKSRKA